MREAKDFLRMVRWPVIFGGLFVLTQNTMASVVLVLLLAYRDDLSVVLRRRGLTVKLPGFEGRVGDPASEHEDPGPNSKSP